MARQNFDLDFGLAIVGTLVVLCQALPHFGHPGTDDRIVRGVIIRRTPEYRAADHTLAKEVFFVGQTVLDNVLQQILALLA